LYHHFPGGKDEMVESVLNHLEQKVAHHLIPTLRGEGDAPTRLKRMCDLLYEVYEGGNQPCMFAILLMGSARDVFHAKVQLLLQDWIAVMVQVLIEAGMAESLAQQRAEDGVISIQGALILSQALNDPTVFQRVLQQLPQNLCRSASLSC